MTPFRLSFIETDDDLSMFIFDIFVDICFGIDIIMNFLTAYYDNKKEELVKSFKKIFIHYIKGWLIIDILAFFPLEAITDSLSTHQE